MAGTAKVDTIDSQTATVGVASQGATDGVAQVTGYIGEVIRYVTAGSSSGSTSVAANLASTVNAAASGNWGDAITANIPAGNWVAYLQGNWVQNGATWTTPDLAIGISTTSGNSNSGLNSGETVIFTTVAATTAFLGQCLCFPLRLTAQTTYYMKFRVSAYSAGTPQLQGVLTIERKS